MTEQLTKKFTSALDVNVTTRAKRDSIIVKGLQVETMSWYQLSASLAATKRAIAADDRDYIISFGKDKNDNDVFKTTTFKRYCEDNYKQFGLSRSRSEELVTAYNILTELRNAGIEIEDLPTAVNHCTLLNRMDIADRVGAWEEYLKEKDLDILKPKKEIIEGEVSDSDIVEDVESEEVKPLEWFAAQFLERLKDREIEDADLMAVMAEQIIQKLDVHTFKVEEVEDEQQ